MFTPLIPRYLMCLLVFAITRSLCNHCISNTEYLNKGVGYKIVTFENIRYACDVTTIPLNITITPCSPEFCKVTLKIRSINTQIIRNEIIERTKNEAKLTEIYMENLNITDLGQTTFINFNDLQEIHLKSNKLVTINDGTFSSLPSLEYIDLSINKLTNISRYSFTGTLKLKLLNLSTNFLTTFDALSISSSNQMTLDLSFNNISKFQFEHAAGRFENLNLSHNFFKEVSDCFPAFNVTNLNNNNLRSITNRSCFSRTEINTFIDLGSNRLFELPSGLFDKMSNLQYLYLGNNNLTSLPTESFAKLHTLKALNISHNYLKEFQYGLFDHLENLETLDISYNELSTIKNYLHSLSKLKNLRIDHNKIDVIDTQKMYFDLPHLKYISLDGNRFSCENLINVFRTFKLRGVTVPYGNTKSVDNIHGITCFEDKLVRTEDSGSEIMKNVEKVVLEKLTGFEKSLTTNNKSLTDLFNKGFKSSDFYKYLEKLSKDATYHFNESEFVHYFDKDFKNSSFFKYLEHLNENEMTAADFNKKFYDFFNKDLKNSSFVKYFESIKSSDEVFNDSFIKSKMFNFFNQDFQNSSFYKYMEHLRIEGIPKVPNGENSYLHFQKLVGNADSEKSSSQNNVMIVLLTVQILIVSFMSFVVFKIYVAFVKHGTVSNEHVELINAH